MIKYNNIGRVYADAEGIIYRGLNNDDEVVIKIDSNGNYHTVAGYTPTLPQHLASKGYTEFLTQRESEIYNSISFTPQAPELISIVTSGTINTLTDSTQTFEVDEHVGKVIEIEAGQNSYVGVVLSNTEDTFTFDADLPEIPLNLDVYSIIEAVELPTEMLSAIIAIYLNGNSGAIKLPKVNTTYDRKKLIAYIEQVATGKCYVISDVDDDIFGERYLELLGAKESASLYMHNTGVPHWDIVNTNNMKSYSTAYTDEDYTVATTDIELPLTDNNTVVDNNRRVNPTLKAGTLWFAQNSLYETLYELEFKGIIEKAAGGAEEAQLSVQVYDAALDTYTDDTLRISTTRFAGGNGIQVVSVKVPVSLKFGDAVTVTVKKDDGTFTLNAGSSMTIREI